MDEAQSNNKDIKERMAGEIALAESPGNVMRKWRELFGITQSELAAHIKVSASTISDYESNRRMSPGVGVIKRFVDALFQIDKERGGTVIGGLSRLSTKSVISCSKPICRRSSTQIVFGPMPRPALRSLPASA